MPLGVRDYSYRTSSRYVMEKTTPLPLPPPISKEMEQIDAEIFRHERAIRALRTQRNAATPICRLPVELLCEIFIISRNAESARISLPRSNRWFPLPQTCQYLRSVALSCPSLWAVLNFSATSEWARLMFKRSKDARLYVTATLTYKSKALQAVVSEVLSNTSRLAELDLTGTNEALNEANTYLTQPAPFLRSLHYYQEENNGPSLVFPTDFLGANAPRLRNVDFVRCAIPWDAPIFANLTSLSVENPSPANTATPSQILSILEKTPQLETLLLHRALANMDVLSYRTATRKSHPIRLPNLITLEVLSDAPALTHLLFSIAIPLLVNVQITVFDPSALYDFTPFITALNSCADSPTMFLHQPVRACDFFSSIAPSGLVFRGWRSLMCSLEPPAVEVTFRHHDPRMMMSAARNAMSQRGNDIETMLQNIADALPMSEIRELRLAGNMISQTFGVFERCTQLSTLELRGSEKECISALGVDQNPAKKTKKGKKPKAQLVFPLLQKLSIFEGEFEDSGFERLRKMLTFRERNKARIMTLELEDCSRVFADDVARLEKHVGQVKWDKIEDDPDKDEDDQMDYDEEYDSDVILFTEDLYSDDYY